MPLAAPPLDFVDELRLRRWAREHYVPLDARDSVWHPVVLDEMRRKDTEFQAIETPAAGQRIVPLIDSRLDPRSVHPAHELPAPHFVSVERRADTTRED